MEIINPKQDFCKTDTTHWVIVLFVAAFLVLGWGLYQKKIELDDILDTVNITLAGNTGNRSRGRGWLGLEVQPIETVTMLHLGLPFDGGVLVNRVFKDSPAWRKGLKRGDVICEFDGRPISNTEEIEYLISNLGATETVRLMVYRGKKFEEFYIALSDFPVASQFN